MSLFIKLSCDFCEEDQTNEIPGSIISYSTLHSHRILQGRGRLLKCSGEIDEFPIFMCEKCRKEKILPLLRRNNADSGN